LKGFGILENRVARFSEAGSVMVSQMFVEYDIWSGYYRQRDKLYRK
jgi:hypothetical protein